MTARTILVIDDTPDHLDFLRRLLGAVGYRVITADTHTPAVDTANSNRPDLIVMSLSYPGDAAWESARQLGDQSELSHTPILGTTVYSPLLNQSRARAIGVVDYVEKPFNVDYLLDRISQLIQPSPAAMAA